METYIRVADFYAGKSVFITGGTGFLGKALTEKLLYSCPEVGNIYLLIRDKKKLSIANRTNKYFDSPIFNRLNKERPENLKKIIFVHGDLTQTNLGLDDTKLSILQNEVSVVFHLAATVRFNEPLSTTVKINVEGTREVLNLCRNMKKRCMLLGSYDVFVYMSTIFSNTTQERTYIEEKLYPTSMPWEQVYAMIKEYDENKVFNPELLDGRPNTYTFTKALAENLIASNRGDFNTVIVRPSIGMAVGTARPPHDCPPALLIARATVEHYFAVMLF